MKRFDQNFEKIRENNRYFLYTLEILSVDKQFGVFRF